MIHELIHEQACCCDLPNHRVDDMQDIAGVVLVAPAIVSFSSHLKARAQTSAHSNHVYVLSVPDLLL